MSRRAPHRLGSRTPLYADGGSERPARFNRNQFGFDTGGPVMPPNLIPGTVEGNWLGYDGRDRTFASPLVGGQFYHTARQHQTAAGEQSRQRQPRQEHLPHAGVLQHRPELPEALLHAVGRGAPRRAGRWLSLVSPRPRPFDESCPGRGEMTYNRGLAVNVRATHGGGDENHKGALSRRVSVGLRAGPAGAAPARAARGVGLAVLPGGGDDSRLCENADRRRAPPRGGLRQKGCAPFVERIVLVRVEYADGSVWPNQ